MRVLRSIAVVFTLTVVGVVVAIVLVGVVMVRSLRTFVRNLWPH